MRKSFMRIQPVKSCSERHNNREVILESVRKDLSHKNESFCISSIAERLQIIKERYRKSTGRKFSLRASPIREGIVPIGVHHSAEDLLNLALKLESQFGIKTIQAYTHKDEGQFDKQTLEWSPNYHAHIIFDWTEDVSGKTLRMDRASMVELQLMVETHLKQIEKNDDSTDC
jgi:hypothetical protein